MGACGLKTLLKFITKMKQLRKILYAFSFSSSKCVKIARLATQWNPIN